MAEGVQGGFRPGEDAIPQVPHTPPGISFTPAADAGGTDADVLMGYQLFLGRDPESSFVIADAKNSPVGAFIRALMGSGEFQSAVLDRLAARRSLPHENASAAPRPDQLDWLFRHMRVPPRAEQMLRAAPDWAEWLRMLVAIPGFPAAPARGAAPVPDGVTPQPAADGFVLIHIESPKPGERLTAGGVIQGNGWAIAPADVAEVAIELDGRLLTHARYGLPRPDVARSFPHYRHVDHCGFSFSAEVPADTQAEGAAQLSVRVRTVRGDAGQKGVRLLLPTPSAQADATSPNDATPDAAQAAWPIRLAVEEAVADAGRMLRVRGWAVSAARMQPIAILLGNTPLGEAATNLARPDIGAAHPNYPSAGHSGFAFAAPIPAELPHGPNFVRVQARDEAGHVRQTIMPVQIPPHADASVEPARTPADDTAQAAGEEAISASCDMAALSTEGALTLGGWAVAAGGVPTLRVDLDGITLGEVKPARARPDVAARFSANPHATHAGFTFFHQLPRRPKKGVHTLSLLISGPMGGKRVLELPVVPDPNAASTQAKRAPAGVQASPEPTPALPPTTVPGMRLEIDRPATRAGAAHEPVRGALTVAGWAAGRHGISDVSVYCDELMLGHAHLGMRREDIGAAFPEYKGSLLAGYALVLPPGTLPEGQHTIRVLATGTTEEGADPATEPPVFERRFTIRIERYDALPPEGSVRFGVPPAEAALGIGLLERAAWQPEFRIVISAPPATPFDAAALDATLASLSGQVWRRWSATVHLPDAESARLAAASPHVADPSGRVQIAPVPGTRRPAKATQAARPKSAKSAKDQPVLLMKLSPGDRLGADALLELALESAANRQARFIYADELRHDPAQSRRQPFFKPDFSPDLLLGMNYIGRPWAATASLAAEAGLTATSLALSSDYDAVLRLTEAARAASPDVIAHIPRVLADRGPSADAPEAELAAIQAAMARRELPARIEPGLVPGTWRVRQPASSRTPGTARRPRGAIAGRISIIIPTCAAGGLIRTAIKTIRANSAPALKGGREVEIVVLDNTSVRDTRTRTWLRKSADVVVDMPGAFNWSRFNNVGARAATGEYLLFLNDDIEIRQPDWLDAMLDYASRPDVGVVGVRLLYPDGKVQHGGQYLADNHARHAFRFAENTSPGPFGLATVAREVISVTGACQMMRARTFRALGGFEEAHSVVNNDLDLCLRSWQAGLSVIYTPHVTLTHHELASRAALQDSYDEARFLGAWRSRFLRGDPFRSPRLALEADHFGADPEPAILLHAGRRGPPADAVRRILAVKLDHIGDFLTALPAIRSLRRRFPSARIDLLAPAATAELARGEPSLADIHVFDFFHARSGDGQKGIGETELQALATRLAPAHYDIAIDLRMQPETRAVLPYTGATFLAGYDADNRFPFLDVALAWEGDARLVLKRAHVSERLVQLVSATEDACRSEAAPPDATPLAPADVPALAALPAAFLTRPLVCIHPGVGNPVRQWPAANYAALIGLLAEDGMHVVLIGGPDEAAIAEDVLRRVPVPGTAESLVGRVRLGDLAAVMRACKLFVGNNSGPKHLAASLGLPTIGIHSGVVDATEWAPLGTKAAAIRRQMICGPCYLEFASDCPRDLACLTGLRPRDVLAACRRLLI